MTIEERIEQARCNYLNKYMQRSDLQRITIKHWHWHGKPGFISPEATVPRVLDLLVGYIIQEGDEAECLTSQSEYVRECKKWFMENKRVIKKAHILRALFKGIDL